MDVRLTVLEEQHNDKKELWAALGLLQEQMTVIFNKLGIKPLEKKPTPPGAPKPPATANGKLPVKNKAKESPL